MHRKIFTDSLLFFKIKKGQKRQAQCMHMAYVIVHRGLVTVNCYSCGRCLVDDLDLDLDGTLYSTSLHRNIGHDTTKEGHI